MKVRGKVNKMRMCMCMRIYIYMLQIHKIYIYSLLTFFVMIYEVKICTFVAILLKKISHLSLSNQMFKNAAVMLNGFIHVCTYQSHFLEKGACPPHS